MLIARRRRDFLALGLMTGGIGGGNRRIGRRGVVRHRGCRIEHVMARVIVLCLAVFGTKQWLFPSGTLSEAQHVRILLHFHAFHTWKREVRNSVSS